MLLQPRIFRSCTLQLGMGTLCAVLLWSAGCQLSGTWVTVETSPKDAHFPIERVILTSDDLYTAVVSHHSETQAGARAWTETETGTYQLSGKELLLQPAGKEPHRYRAKRTQSDTLVLEYSNTGSAITATLLRTDK